MIASIAYANGVFGPSEAFSQSSRMYCDFVRPAPNFAAQSICLIAILYSAYAFATVHKFVHTSLISNVESLPAAEREAAQLRLRLWPRFVLYSLSFLLTQLPDLVLLVLQLVLPHGTPDTVDSAADAIAQLHGGVNALVFSCTNARAFLAQQMPSNCCSTCCTVGDEEDGGRTGALLGTEPSR